MAIEKRYQHWSRDGIVFTPWFKIRDTDEDYEHLVKEEKWQMKNKLKNEYRIVQEDNNNNKKV